MRTRTYTACSNVPDLVFRCVPELQKQVTFSVPDGVIRECKAKEISISAFSNLGLIALRAACSRVTGVELRSTC